MSENPTDKVGGRRKLLHCLFLFDQPAVRLTESGLRLAVRLDGGKGE